jgi:predicted Zn-dependent protease
MSHRLRDNSEITVDAISERLINLTYRASYNICTAIQINPWVLKDFNKVYNLHEKSPTIYVMKTTFNNHDDCNVIGCTRVKRNCIFGSNEIVAHAIKKTNNLFEVHLNENCLKEKHLFDDDDIFLILMHELGHCFGVNHNLNQKSIMFPYYIRSNLNYNNNLSYNVKEDLDFYNALCQLYTVRKT